MGKLFVKTATLGFAMAAIVSGALGETFSQVAFLIIGFALNLAGQGVAICSTTILQEEVDDHYRGRVFSFYDMTFNVTFVAGAGLSAVFMPVNGRSAVIIGVVAVGYAVTAAGYWVASRLPAAGRGQPGGAPDASGGSGGSGGGQSPSASAQRSSS